VPPLGDLYWGMKNWKKASRGSIGKQMVEEMVMGRKEG